VTLRRWESGGEPSDCASTLCGLIRDAADVTPAAARIPATTAQTANTARRLACRS
jgi:hypothetical protein